MASDRLTSWAEGALKVVDESGESTSRVRLVAHDGAVWQTWNAPFDSAEEWADSARALLLELGEEITGQQEVRFVAETSVGVVRSQMSRTISGRKQRAGTGGFGGAPANGTSGMQQMFDAQAKTTDKVLQSANVQIDVLTRTVEAQAKTNAELLQFIGTMNERDALAKEASTNQTQEVLGQLMEQAPIFLQLLAQKKSGKSATPSVKPVAAAVENLKTSVTEAAVGAVANGAADVVTNVLTKGN